MKKTIFSPLFYSMLCTAVLFSCGEQVDQQEEVEEEVFDPNSSLHTVFDGKIFSIPSPVLTGYLVKKLNVDFDKSLLNNDANVGDYASEHKQALNLGIYGTDLGYCALYDQKDASSRYLKAVEKITGQLGLDAAFDTNFLSKFEENNGNEDEMIRLMSQAFKKADNFLKNANRKKISAKILAGGWIESMYFACELNEKKSSDEIKRRIGEQKQSLESIIELLSEYNKDGKNDQLIEDLKDLKVSFDKIQVDYEYEAPDTDKDNHITEFNHTFSVTFDESVVKEITEKVRAIRTSIIKA